MLIFKIVLTFLDVSLYTRYMETVKLNSHCKLCKLLLRYPTIWERVHDMVLEDGTTQVAAVEYLNGEVAKLNASLPESKVLPMFNRANVATHFKRHVSDRSTLATIVSGSYSFNLNEVPKGRTIDNSMLQTEPISTSADDFSRMHQLVEASFVRLTRYDQKLNELNDDGSTKDLELSDIQLFQKLIKESMQMKKELSSLQQSAEIAGEALHECVQTVVRVTMDDLKSVLVDAKTTLSRELPGSSLPDETMSLILNAVGKTFSTTIPEVLESIEKRYKIK